MADRASVLGEALTLDPKDKAAVIVRLLESLDGEAEGDVVAAWDVEIGLRVEEVRAGTSNSQPLDDALRELDEIVDE